MKEFADFLSGQPPFDALDPDDLARLAMNVEVEYFAPGAVLVREDERLEHLWVVRTGALEVLDKGRVVDLLGPGDIVGHVSLLSQLPHGVLVRAYEESLCLRMRDPRDYLAHPQRLSFARITPVPRPTRLVGDGSFGSASKSLKDVARPVVWCRAEDRVRDVARQIGATGESCALVGTSGGLGIVTDHDFRWRVATGDIALDAPVERIATVPALTIAADATLAAGLVQMVEHGVHHLVVADQAGEPVGVVRVVDLARVEVRDPLLIRSAIQSAATVDALAEACRSLPGTLVALHDQEVAAPQIGALHSAIVDAAVRRAIALRLSPALAEVRLSWVLLGSLARREPLPRSDIDTALVWADPAGSVPDPSEAARAFAGEVLADLRRCGLPPCPSGTNADNPRFSRSQSGWATAADEMTLRRAVVPLRALEGEDPAAGEDDQQRREGRHPEHVDPGGDVGRLPVRQQLLRWQCLGGPPTQPGGPHPVVRGTHGRRLPLGNGSTSARKKTRSVKPITIRLATEIWMTPQCRYVPG